MTNARIVGIALMSTRDATTKTTKTSALTTLTSKNEDDEDERDRYGLRTPLAPTILQPPEVHNS